MNDENGNKFFSRSNVLLWTPAIAGILIVQIIFGWSKGPSGILWNIGPVVTGLSYCLGFLLFGRFLTDRVKWPMQLAILFASAIVLVLLGFVLLVAFASTDPTTEFGYFLPGQTVFWLVLFFSSLLTLLGFIPRMRVRKNGP